MISEWKIQVAIMARLKEVLPKVFDHVPAEEARPYSTLGASDIVPFRTLSSKGARTTMVVHHWGNDREDKIVHGNRQVLAAAEAARVALDGKPFALEDGTVIGVRWEQTAELPDPQPNVRHVTTRFRIDVR